MKKLTLPLLVLVIAFSACAQSSHLDRFYQQYHTNSGDGFDPSILFNASFHFGDSYKDGRKEGRADGSGRTDGNHDGNSENWTHKITSIRCLILDGKKTPNVTKEWSDLSASLRADHFEEWFSVRQGQGRLQLMSRDKDDIMEEVACLIVGDDGGGLFFHLKGHFTAADRARIEQALQSHDSE